MRNLESIFQEALGIQSKDIKGLDSVSGIIPGA